MGILNKLFGQNKQKPKQQAKWQSYFSNVDDKFSSIAVDLGLYPIAPIQGQDNVVFLSIKMNNPREDGLSSSDEAPKLWEIEDELEAGFDKANLNYCFAGRLTSNGFRDLYYFTDNSILLEKVISGTMVNFSKYQFDFGHKEDKEWSGYFNFLYPTPRQMQSIQNKQVLEQLEQGGDTLTKEREVRHWVYFNTQQEMDDFEKFTLTEGFTTINKGTTEQPSEYAFVIIVSRIDRVGYNEIDEYTLQLWEKAIELNGDYDGWETSIEK